MAGIRKDIAKLSDDWASELLWYARAVGELRQRPASDRTGWRYFGAIHGININGWITQGLIGSAAELPPQREQDFLFNQCQHAGWFFLPWHRGYLAAFEAVLDDWIQSNGGPSDWALPYWNYLDDGNPNARNMPQAFLDATLPDGTPNPLADANRTGATSLGPQPWLPRDISLDAQTDRVVYTANPGTIGYGGALSGFAHQGDLTGGVEGDPHNPVHVMIGGPSGGWMSDPDFAALDPIFWMHHCNIDRLWEAWMSEPSHQQEISSAFRNGPFPQQFMMPNPLGGVDVFTPGDTLPGGPLAPSYDDIHDGTGIVRPVIVTEATGAVSSGPPSNGTAPATGSTLVGANDAPISVSGGATATKVQLTTKLGGATTESPLARKPETFLNLEGVRGQTPSGVLSVYLTTQGQSEPELIDSVVLFGLAKASKVEGRHAGNGLTMALDISDYVNKLQGAGVEEIEVQVNQPGDPTTEVTVDRISIFTQ